MHFLYDSFIRFKNYIIILIIINFKKWRESEIRSDYYSTITYFKKEKEKNKNSKKLDIIKKFDIYKNIL